MLAQFLYEIRTAPGWRVEMISILYFDEGSTQNKTGNSSLYTLISSVCTSNTIGIQLPTLTIIIYLFLKLFDVEFKNMNCVDLKSLSLKNDDV